jgi:VanZ family protein
MKPQSHSDSRPSASTLRWSSRIVVLSLAGILFLTLYPFRLSLRAHPVYVTPFLLRGWEKPVSVLDAILNILLFVPFGFGMAGLLRKRGSSRGAVGLLTLIAGAALSYSVEFTQFFTPGRESSWKDVLTNSTGAFLGGILFQMAGVALLRPLQVIENFMESFATTRRVLLILACYLLVWLGVSAYLQRASNLRDWDANASLNVGRIGHAWSDSAWQGQVEALDFWNQALPSALAARVSSARQPIPGSPVPTTSFLFAGSAPFRDEEHSSPDLVWVAKESARGQGEADDPGWNGRFWLATAGPASAIVTPIRASSRFTIHLQFVPSRGEGVDAEIVSLTPPIGAPDLQIRQEATALSFWFRTPLAPSPRQLEWSISNVCTPTQALNVVFSYDGSSLWAYLNGKFLYADYRLGPGAALASRVRHLRTSELPGYRYFYWVIVFWPAGCLLGFGWRKSPRNLLSLAVAAVFGMVLPCALFEVALVHLGSQPFSSGDLALAIAFSALGWFWINLENSVDDAQNTWQSKVGAADAGAKWIR